MRKTKKNSDGILWVPRSGQPGRRTISQGSNATGRAFGPQGLRLWSAGSLAIAGWLLLNGCSGGVATSQPVAPAVPVMIATAITTDVPVQVTAIGNVHAYSTVQVKTRVDGALTQVGFRQGDAVKKEQLIFTIDPRPFQAALDLANANLERDVAAHRSAKADWQRTKELENTKAISASAVDQARAKVDSLKATVDADAAEVENAKLQLAYCFIRSPIDGRIGLLLVNEGNMVKNNDTILAVINQIQPIYVDCSLPEQELPRLRQYMHGSTLPVEAQIPNDTGPAAVGRLVVLNNAVDATTGTITLRAEFPNADEKLWPGQFVNVAVTLTTQRGAVLVPHVAIQPSQQGQFVFVIQADNIVTNRAVVAGADIGSDTVVEQGLQAGEQVVTSGQLRLVPGMKVQPQIAGAPAAKKTP